MLLAIDSTIVFVFGSNEAGRHGRGAALTARTYYGAITGRGHGMQGLGKYGSSYAIATKDRHLQTRALHAIATEIDIFLQDAKDNPDLTFKVTRVGCGLAGYKDKDIAPLFAGAPANCFFDPAWKPWGFTPWDVPPIAV